jgi:hypothetical protein
MENITYEKYYVYFFILSFFVLITIIAIYKKSNKLVICVAIIILVIQLFIVYDTYNIVEPVSANVASIKSTQGKITEMSDISKQSGKTDLGNVYAEFNVINGKQTNVNTPVLNIVNSIGAGNYASFDELSVKKPISTFSEANIKDMIFKTDASFNGLLTDIKTLMIPKQ